MSFFVNILLGALITLGVVAVGCVVILMILGVIAVINRARGADEIVKVKRQNELNAEKRRLDIENKYELNRLEREIEREVLRGEVVDDRHPIPRYGTDGHDRWR